MAGQGSARVSLREIDLSAPTPVNRVLTGTPAGVVGRAKRGPAFVPTVFADIQEFQDTFGSFSDKGLDSNSNLFGPLAVSEWMSGNPGQGAFVRLLGVGSEPGFIVGTKKLGTDGVVISNSNAVNTSSGNTTIDVKGKSFILGHFVKDATNSKYLTEAGLQLQSFETATITVDKSKIVAEDDFSITPIGANETARQFTFKAAVTNVASQILIPTTTIGLISNISTNFTELSALKTTLQTEVTALNVHTDPIDPVTDAFTDLQNKYSDLVTNKNSLKDAIVLDSVKKVIGSDLDVIDALITNLQTNLTAISASITTLNNASDINTFTAAKAATAALITTFTDLIDNDDNDVVFKFNALKTKLTDNFLQACEIKKSIDAAFPDYKITASVDGAIVKLVQLVDAVGAATITVDTENMTDAVALTIEKNQSNVSTAIPLVRGILMTPHNVKASLKSTIASKTTAPVNENVQDPIGYEIGNLSQTDNFTLFLTGYNGQNKAIECSFDINKSNYFYKVLNTDPHKIEELGHYLHSYYDIHSNVITSSIDGITASGGATSVAAAGAFCVANDTRSFEEFDNKFQTAVSPWVVSQDFGIVANGSNNDGMGDGIFKLFRFHALDDGEIGNQQVRILVSNLTPGEFGGFGTFDITLQKWDSNPLKSSILASWKRLSLDASASNYIARVIGDKKVYWDFEATKPGLQEEGSYPVTNKFVRVEVSGEVAVGDIAAETLPCGFAGIKKLHLKSKFNDKSQVLNAQHLHNLQQPPIPMIRSIGKIIQGASDPKDAKIVPWGVKFALKENIDVTIDGFKEYIEQTFNKSLVSYTKYFKNNWSPVIVEGSLTEELDYTNDPNFFHLEKIRVTHQGGAALKIDNKKWGDAIFIRNSVTANDSVPTGADRRFFRLTKDLSLSNNKYLSFSFFMQGGFDGLDIFDEDKHYLKDAACYKEGQKTSKTGPVIETYQQGIDVYTDKAAAEIQLLVVPGIRERLVTNYAVQAAENRFDTMYIMDIEQKNANGAFIINATDKPSVGQTIDEFSGRGMDTSFAASFFPDVMLNKPNGGSIKVPPSIAALGVMSRADNGGNAPWYAPAGINRGLVNASATEFAMSREQLDELYDSDINPIYIPAGRDQVHVFGQKTLLKNPSALDRINVRRLLIYVRRKVKAIANTFLFQPNRADTLKAFSNAVEPILANIQAQQGIERYKVQIDTTTTTQSDVENNTIRGKIYLQPTKSIEFISLDFEVRNSID